MIWKVPPEFNRRKETNRLQKTCMFRMLLSRSYSQKFCKKKKVYICGKSHLTGLHDYQRKLPVDDSKQAQVEKDIQGGSHKLLLTTKESIVSNSIFSGPHCSQFKSRRTMIDTNTVSLCIVPVRLYSKTKHLFSLRQQ